MSPIVCPFVSRSAVRDRSREFERESTMTTNTATGTTSILRNKRVRIEDDPQGPSPTTASTTAQQAPKTLAIAFLKANTASLHPTIATILERLGTDLVVLLSKCNNKQLQVERMESDLDFIPRSARMEFVFHLSKQAKETMEFSSLLQETETLLSACRLQLKNKVLAATKIEIKIGMSNIIEAMAKAFRLAVQAFMIFEQTKDVDIDILTRKIVSMHADTLLKHAGCTGPEFDLIFLKLNKEADDDEVIDVDADDEANMDTSSVDEDTTATGTAPPAASAPSQSQSRFFGSQRSSQPSQLSEASTATGNLTQQSQASIEENLASLATANPTTAAPPAPPAPAATTLPEPEFPTLVIANALRAVFVTSWDEYLKQQEKNAVALELKKLHADYFATDSTKKAVKLVDNESPASRDQLRSLVRVEIQEEIRKVEKKPPQKKNKQPSTTKKQKGRGQEPQGSASRQQKKKTASNNKNNTANRQPKTSRSPSRGRQRQRGQQDQRADGSANASNGGNNSRGRSSKRGNAGKNKKSSNTTRTKR